MFVLCHGTNYFSNTQIQETPRRFPNQNDDTSIKEHIMFESTPRVSKYTTLTARTPGKDKFTTHALRTSTNEPNALLQLCARDGLPYKAIRPIRNNDMQPVNCRRCLGIIEAMKVNNPEDLVNAPNMSTYSKIGVVPSVEVRS